MNKEKKCLLITSAFAGLLLLIFLIIGLTTQYYGLVIGWSIGSVITIISQILIFKSGKLIGTDKMDTTRGTVLVILFYASRFLMYAAGLVVCALLDFKFRVPVFKYSIWTCLGALLPTHIILAIFYKDKEEKKIETTTNNIDKK